MLNNPLLSESYLPDFSEIEPRHVAPALDFLLDLNRRELARLLRQSSYSWSNLIAPIERMEHRLARAWSQVRHLNSVVNTSALREIYNEYLPKLTEYSTELTQNVELYQAYRSIVENAKGEQLSPLQRRSLEKALRDFKLGGVDLTQPAKARFKEISRRLTEIGARFEDHVLDSTNAWIYAVEDESELYGLPDSALDLLKHAAGQRSRDGYVVTLDFPVYQAVMTYADQRELRERVYNAYTTRASELFFDPQWDNGLLMDEILPLRHELAGLLGYRSYAEYALVTKMAQSPSQVIAFLQEMAQKARPFALKEKQTLGTFAAERFGYLSVEPWDVAYLSEKMKQNLFDVSQEELKPFFPIDRVISGLFGIIRRVFDIEVREASGVSTWHPDVRFFELYDTRNELRGQFYLDLYARPKKRSGAWMDECVGRMSIDAEIATPVAYLTCNAAPPVGGKPALLTHDEVTTLLHEFGHGLHHMLTRIDIPSIAGINGVEWDAVELPSQWMENWAWHREGLALLSGHFESGAPLPDALLDKLLALRKFQAGLQFVRQIEFALFDMRLHDEYTPDEGLRIADLLAEIRSQVAVIVPPSYNRFPNTFTHIFSGGYAAGYYSYKWAEVLSADAFGLFIERGVFNREVGESFLREVLEVGSSRPALASFVAFRGREPSSEPLLEDAGLRSAH